MKKSSALRQKLHSQRGASLVITLLFFLLCLMVAAVTLTAASASVGRTVKQRKEQQAYLSVSSAGELLQREIEAMPAFAARKEVLSHQCGKPSYAHISAYEFDGMEGEWAYADTVDKPLLESYLWEDALTLCKAPNTVPASRTFTAEPETDSGALAVQVKMTTGQMKTEGGVSSYQIVFTLTALDPDDPARTLSAYKMELSLDAEITDTNDGGRNDPAKRQCIYKTGRYVLNPYTYEWVEETAAMPYRLTTYTKSVQWSHFKLTKEA
ncbi:MAG: hypothetical protein VB023_05295 [Oscillibacter sp.]|nr:hypothetical protein [Oscillibacter sp.]